MKRKWYFYFFIVVIIFLFIFFYISLVWRKKLSLWPLLALWEQWVSCCLLSTWTVVSQWLQEKHVMQWVLQDFLIFLSKYKCFKTSFWWVINNFYFRTHRALPGNARLYRIVSKKRKKFKSWWKCRNGKISYSVFFLPSFIQRLILLFNLLWLIKGSELRIVSMSGENA